MAEPRKHRKHRKKYPSSLSQKYKMKANCSPCQISPSPLEPHRLMMTWRKFISWPFSIKPFAPLYQQVKKSGRKHFLSHGIFRPLTRPLRANIPQPAGLNCRRDMPLVKLYCGSFRFPSGWKKCRLLLLLP